MMVIAVRSSKTIKNTPQYIRRRSYKFFDPEYFKMRVRQLGWLEIYLSDNVNEALSLLTSKLTSILDEIAPMRRIQLRQNYNPWISQETLNLMKERDDLNEKASNSGNREDWKKYKTLRNKINNRLKFEERSWQSAKLKQCNGDSKTSWNTIKTILNWKNYGAPCMLFHDGQLKTKSQDIADSQNECFVNKINTIKSELPPPKSDPLKGVRLFTDKKSCPMKLSAVHPDEV